MRTSCITHPPRMRVAVIKEDYYTICDGDACAALLLAYFEHWHNQKLNGASQAGHQRQMALLHGEPPPEDEGLWQYHTAQDLQAAIFHEYGREKIRAAIRRLEAKGFIQTGHNPNPKYKYDRTTFFLFRQTHVQSALDDAYPQVAVHVPKMAHGAPETGRRAAKNGTAISESSSQEISKEEEPSLNGSQREPHRDDPSPRPASPPAALEEEATHVLAYLNQVSGHHYGYPNPMPALTGIKARLTAGATDTECRLVIDWYQQVRLREWPQAAQYFDPDTLFRPKNFDKYLGRARAWEQQGRPPLQPVVSSPLWQNQHTARTSAEAQRSLTRMLTNPKYARREEQRHDF